MEKITQGVIFPELFNKPMHCRFDEPHSSSDGGTLLLKAADKKLGLTTALAGSLVDLRQAGKVKHSFEDLLRQRIYGLAAGYADTNDAARLGSDPMFKSLLDRCPITGAELSSQPTLSRFENWMGPRENYSLALALAGAVIARQRQRRRRRTKAIIIDLDSTDDPTHGQQQLSFFNAHYGTYCYLTLLAFLTFDGEAEPYLVSSYLRPGKASEKAPVVTGLLARLVGLVRAAFPHAQLTVRLDGGFAGPELLAYLDGVPNLQYVLGLAKNAVLTPQAEKLLERARKRVARTGHSERGYRACRYRAGTWERQRRVIIKAEVTCQPGRTPKDNPRFLVTNMRGKPQALYAFYCGRGEIENRIKELHHGLEIDRTSCSSFQANQFRVLLTTAAYALLQELRTQARGTTLAHAQVTTLRDHLFKLSVRVTASVRRIVLHLPETFAYAAEWARIARRLGAVPG